MHQMNGRVEIEGETSAMLSPGVSPLSVVAVTAGWAA